jgi:DivIVA domain-containing protein
MSSVEFTADVVRNTKFRDKMRGYSQDEVDGFMERTATALDMLQDRISEMTERALKAEAALDSNSEADESIRKTLTLAQRTADLAVQEANDDAGQIRSDAHAYAEQLRADADREREEATVQAATIVADARADADERIRSCEERLAAMERESNERIAQAQEQADAEMAAKAEAAERALAETVANLTSQRDDLYAQVEALSGYLANERGRVVGALRAALDGFSETLNSSPRPAPVAHAMAAGEAAVEVVAPEVDAAIEPELDAADEADEADEADGADDLTAMTPVSGTSLVDAIGSLHDQLAAEPEPGPADVWFATDMTAPLMFSMAEGHRQDGEPMDGEEPELVPAKPKKSLLGRKKG